MPAIGISGVESPKNSLVDQLSFESLENGVRNPEANEVGSTASCENGKEENDLSPSNAILSGDEKSIGHEAVPTSDDLVATDTTAICDDSSTENSLSKWAEVLSTPSDNAAFTPAADMSVWKENFHGLGLKLAADRAKTLSRTGKSCATLLLDIATIYDDLALSILKLCPSILESAASGTPIGDFAGDVNKCIISFAKQTQGLGICIRNDIARPWLDFSASMAETAPSVYLRYVSSRGKCAQTRKEAIKTRQKYVGVVKEADTAIQSLRRANSVKELRRSSEVLDDTCQQNMTALPPDPKGQEVEWDDALRKFGKKHGLTKHCETVIRTLEDVQTSEAKYCTLVDVENAAVASAQAMEKMGLESLQKLEEQRIIFINESLGRLFQAEKTALDNMLLDINVEPLNFISENNLKELPVPSTTTSLFMSPRRRTQSDDGSASTEARILNLPENIAALRDHMKSLVGRQSARLQALKSVCTFNEEVATAIQTLASSLHCRLENDGYARKMDNKKTSPLSAVLNENEGTQTLNSWNSFMTSLEAHAQYADDLAKQIKGGNHELYKILLTAEKELKLFRENEESRWKSLCDAAKSEAKAKQRHEQYVVDLGKARNRLSSVDDGIHPESVEDTPVSDGTKSPQKAKLISPSAKMTPSMNKAMGKMFSILPGGGEDVMAKVLKPEQRLAIAKRSLDDAIIKEAKGTESFEAASEAKQHAIAFYETEASVAESKFKTDDHFTWNELQKSLECSVNAVRSFRDNIYACIEPSMDAINNYKSNAIFNDMIQWTKDTEKKVTDHRTRFAVDSKGQDNQVDVGFSLSVHLEESSDVKELVSLVTTDENSLSSGLHADREKSEVTPSGSSSSLPKQHNGAPRVDLTNQIMDTDMTGTSIEVAGMASNKKDLLTLAESLMSTSGSELPSPNEKAGNVGMTKNESEVVQKLKSFAGSIKISSERNKEPKGDSPSVAMAKNSTGEESLNTDTEVLLSTVWEDGGDEVAPPTVIQSFSCAYWPKEGEGFISPLLHGRMFVTSPAMYFTGWGDKKIKLDWHNAISVSKEATMMGTIDNALRISYNNGEGIATYFFGSFAYRDDAFHLINKLITIAKSLEEFKGETSENSDRLPDVPADTILERMDPILSKKLKNVSIEKYYEVGWSESTPFYGPWLEKKGSFDISVGNWEYSDDGFEHAWSGETFPQRRVVRFKFKRTSHLYIGPPIAGVTQTQYCRQDGNDKCILMMTVDMDGIPYSDSFAVEVRWVARRFERSDLVVDAGVFVRFTKSNMFSKQIKSGTLTETKPIHLDLFEAIKSALASEQGNIGDLDTEQDENEELKLEAIRHVSEDKRYKHSIMQQISGLIQTLASKELLLLKILLLIFATLLCFVLPTFSSRRNTRHIEEVAQRVELLSDDLREMKSMLEQILFLIKENDNQKGEF